jgi:predicted DCC family thiol-disulfide oxidoreductase YuxK
MSRWAPVPAPDLPDGLILFDGVCVFCSRWVRFVIARDPEARFRFLPIQSEEGRSLAERLGVNPDAPETNVAVMEGRALMKSDAALAVLGALKGLRWLRALRHLPRWLRDPLYDLIARNRYALFGRTEACWLPAPGERARFL